MLSRVAVASRTIARSAPKTVASIYGRNFAMFYTKEHEYLNLNDDKKTGTLGITAFAQESLGELVYAELPEVGAKLAKGESFCNLESVKAASSVYMPCTGTVTSVNEDLSGKPSLINESPLEKGWIAKINVEKDDYSDLMDEAAYKTYLKDCHH